MSTAKRLPNDPAPALRAVEPDESPPEIDLAWRAGRPLEDPEKTKRWGIVTAKPSEYLIHMRHGRIRRRGTGQGASCFKWPWDSIAIIPTTINRLQFHADQVTLEKVGVRVTGLAVYRIVEPEIAFRMLNFSYAERASEKLAEILGEMFVGATRRHVANLGVEDVMTRRKDAIAGELLAELAPVLAGRGRTEDSTPMGWGVVLDTVEIQDVRVLSEEVFANMQATFRAELATRARMAELARTLEIAAREAEHTRQIEVARLQADAETRRLRAESDSRTTETELAEEERRAELRAQAERAKLEREARLQEAHRTLLERRHETARRQLELEAERRIAEAETEAALREAESEANARLRARELELLRAADDVQLATARAHRAIEDTISDARIRMELVARTMPALAEAFAQQIGELKLTQIGGAIDPAAMIANGFAGVVDIARALGLVPPAPSD